MDEVSNWDTTVEILQLFRDLARTTAFTRNNLPGNFYFYTARFLGQQSAADAQLFYPCLSG